MGYTVRQKAVNGSFAPGETHHWNWKKNDDAVWIVSADIDIVWGDSSSNPKVEITRTQYWKKGTKQTFHFWVKNVGDVFLNYSINLAAMD